MHQPMFDYIAAARAKGLTDPVTKSNLVLAGWDASLAEAALLSDGSFPAPPAPQAQASAPAPAPVFVGSAGQLRQNEPIAVVSNYTTRGLEYIIMFIALGVTALALGLVLHNLVDMLTGVTEGFYESLVSYATAALIVGMPVFLVLFLRLKRAELRDKSIMNDPSRKRAIQLTLIITFLVGIWKVISYIYSLLNVGTQNYSDYGVNPTIGGNFAHTLITLLIAGGIFAYYWRDSHKSEMV